jgi:pimeloyl-ACP methyl ester carboxylesterase
MVDYDEFGLLVENASEFGIPFDDRPSVRRTFVELDDGRRLSALVWGTEPPRVVFLHGGAQNAHTWDTVALALNWPLVAIDLPGHGHSDGPRDESGEQAGGRVGPQVGYAEDVAVAVRALAPDAAAIVGMSAGGITAIVLTTVAAELVRKLVLVDILPNPDPAAGRLISDFVDGPETFESFEQILARTIAFNPSRSVVSLRRGILHNAVQLEDGRWQWRHQRHRGSAVPQTPEAAAAFYDTLWTAIAAYPAPIMLVRGMEAGSVVTDEQEARLRHEVPSARVEHVTGAGHSVQGDRPLHLASLIEQFVQ